MSRMRNLVESFSRKGTAGEPAEPAVRPVYELKETPEAWGLTAYLPGVAKEGLELTAEAGLITCREIDREEEMNSRNARSRIVAMSFCEPRS